MTAGGRLLFFADGVRTTANPENVPFGQNGLVSIAANALSVDLFDMLDVVLDDVGRYCAGRPQTDLTLVVAEVK